ncbi:MAG: FtsX-like permease family protein, partial [Bacteroidota bacterium]
DALDNMPEVKSHTVSSFLPLDDGTRNSLVLYAEGQDPNTDQVSTQYWPSDEHYLPTLGIELANGRNFNPAIASDSNSVIINETLAKKLGIADDPINKRVVLPFDDGTLLTIIGVIKDFHYNSLREEIGGLCLVFGEDRNTIAIKTEAAQMQQLIAKTEKLWSDMQPGTPFRYNFLDDKFATLYAGEQSVGTTFSIFASLAIFIACLGLFALAIFMIEQRKKEIGVRKVLGASVANIVLHLNKQFAVLVLIAALIAIPLSWYFMNQWLQDFSYSIELKWWVFLIGGIVALSIAILTVSTQSIKAALSNPIESLRSE